MFRVIVFDVNETLLDLQALDSRFAATFGNATVRQEWFTQMIQSALVSTVTNAYTDFGQLGMAALEMVASRHGVTLTDVDRQGLRDGMSTLPPHPEVRRSLDRLRNAGLRLATLTNSTEAVAMAQVTHAGLRDFFDRVLSADTIHRLKPAAEPYHMAAEQMGVPIDQMCLVAAHAWDIAGALRAGSAAAFVARAGKVLDPLIPRPDILGADLSQVVDLIVNAEKGYMQ